MTSKSGIRDPHHVPQHISTAKFPKRRCGFSSVCLHMFYWQMIFWQKSGRSLWFKLVLVNGNLVISSANNRVSPCSVNNHTERGHVPWKLILPSHELMKVMVQLGGGNSNIFWNFHPETWGRWTQFDDHIFQMGWNHQLGTGTPMSKLDPNQ